MGSARYYLNLKTTADHANMVHRDGCPFLPGREKRLFLGVYENADDPVNSGREYGMNSRKCIFCCSPDREVQPPDSLPLIRTIPEEQWDSVFVSSVN
jgi:hypothetical protein